MICVDYYSKCIEWVYSKLVLLLFYWIFVELDGVLSYVFVKSYEGLSEVLIIIGKNVYSCVYKMVINYMIFIFGLFWEVCGNWKLYFILKYVCVI